MKKTAVVIGMVAVSGILYACGGSSSKGGSGVTTTVPAPAISTTKTPVSSPVEAAKTVNASKTLASSFASGSSFPSLSSLVGKPAVDQAANGHKIISTVRDLQQRAIALQNIPKKIGKYVAAISTTGPIPCDVSGSRTVTVNDTTGEISITANNCKENYELTNGTMSLSGISQGATTVSGGSIVLNMSTISYASGGYTVKEHESVLSMTMAVASFDEAAGTSSLSINGTQTQIDHISGTSDKQAFGNFSLTMFESQSGSIIASTDMTMNGTVSMDTFSDSTFTTIDSASGMAFKDLHIVNTVNSTDLLNVTYALSINGTYAIKTIPSCMDGTFAITTSSPITTSNSGTSGAITVNDVAMNFNPDGSVTATINGVPQNVPPLDQQTLNACSMSF